MARVLITGVAGFIGSNLADRLLGEGHNVVGLDTLVHGVPEQVPKEVELRHGDIRSKEIYPFFQGIDFVFHLAAKNCIPDCQKDPVGTADINVTGTANIFDAARRAGVKKVVYAESAAMYEKIKTMPTPEDEVMPETFYGISKLCNHLFAKAYQQFYGLKTVGLRYFNVYGPRQDYRRTIPPVASAFIIKFLKGEQPIIFGDGTKRYDFIHVDDINDFHLLCIKDSRVDNRVFNLGTGKNYSILELYDIVARIMGSNLKPVHKPAPEDGAETSLADNRRAKEMGWLPKTNLEDGLRGMVDYVKNEFKKGNIK
ncbi:MAG: NAD-dependent epimerase/dehydratase family protein [Candidatus Liptonbacteria bacterium]|nr:NAD-dependent epimerase/dehydratase family protein [Candidatus Liptonbacteria bacterium]